MSRKQDFDPLGGFVGGSVDKRSRKNKKSFDVLGSGKYGDNASIFDEGCYEPVAVTGYSDARLITGGEEPAEKRSLFGRLFKKKQKPAAAAAQDIQSVQDLGFDSRGYELDIKDDVMGIGLTSRYEEEENAPLFDGEFAAEVTPSVPEQPAEEELFCDDDLQTPENNASVPDEVAKHENIEEDLFAEPSAEEKPSTAVPLNPHVCHLCGRVSQEELPEFGFTPDEFVPLCRICTRAVNTLMKHTDHSEEVEIYSEWSSICPDLDEKRAKKLINIGRKSL